MATTKSAGTVKTGRDSQPKYLGVKLYGGQKVKTGSVIIRQRGTKFFPGINVKKGKDDTLYALADGIIKFTNKTRKRFDGKMRKVKVVNVQQLS